ncbi:WD40 repeat-like protein [Wallemia mellicola]|uniref:WD40 repeat-like protein n=1 Tax=Wallemia mellicola TaxID=1708541 RepID=A0A4T0NK01_9BASI|nr:WD40 repeat-like protein [Wallemia mellicola]
MAGKLWHQGNLLIVAVGLPARGKTHVSRSIERYIRWLGVKVGTFSLGDYRRKTLGRAKDLPPDYFLPTGKSENTEKLREKVVGELQDTIQDFFVKDGGQVAIYDANNSTAKGRTQILKRFGSEGLGVHVIFLECLCDQAETIESNIRNVKISSPDYDKWDSEKAVQDYWRRIREHEDQYETVQETVPYVKIWNAGQRIVVNKIEGYLQSRIVFYLMNIHNKPRTIYFARNGQSIVEHSYKADSDLAAAGWEYADQLADFILDKQRKQRKERGEPKPPKNERKFSVWTSTRRRSYHSAWPFVRLGYRVHERAQMSELNPGVLDGVGPEEFREQFPNDWHASLKAPYSFRAPRGESYHDLCVRLEPVIFELEREQNDLLIICHASVIRCLIAYLTGLPPSEIPNVEVPRGELIEMVPTAYGVHSRSFKFWEPKPTDPPPLVIRDGILSPRVDSDSSPMQSTPTQPFAQAVLEKAAEKIGLPVTIAVTIYPLVYLRQPDAVTAYLIGNAQIYATILAGSLLTVEIEKTLVKLDKEGNEKAPPVGLWDRFKFYADLLSNPRGIHWKWSRKIDKQGIEEESTKTKWIFIRDRLPALFIYILILDAFETYLHTPPYDILTIRPISAQPATMQVFHLIFFALVAMSAISVSNILASIVTVAIGLSKPKDWPRFFNMKESWSIARLWSVGWHSVFKKTITFYGNAISSVFPRFAQMPIKVLIGFSLTGLSHAMGAYIMAGLGKGQFYFFVIQTVGIVAEMDNPSDEESYREEFSEAEESEIDFTDMDDVTGRREAQELLDEMIIQEPNDEELENTERSARLSILQMLLSNARAGGDRRVYVVDNDEDDDDYMWYPRMRRDRYTPTPSTVQDEGVKLTKSGLIPNSSGTVVARSSAPVYSGEYSNDGQLFYTADRNFNINIYKPNEPLRSPHSGMENIDNNYSEEHATTMSHLSRITGNYSGWTITDSHLSTDNQWLIYSRISPTAHLVKLGNPDNHQIPLSFSDDGMGDYGYGYGIWSLRFSSDCREIVAGAADGTMYVYDVEARKRTLALDGHNEDTNAVCFADVTSNICLSGSDDCVAKVWDRRALSRNAKPSGVLVGHTEGITYVSPKGDARHILTNSKDSTIRIWDLRKMISSDDYDDTAKVAPPEQFSIPGYDYRSAFVPKPEYDKHPQDHSLVTLRGHLVSRTLIRARFSPDSLTGGRYVYSGSADGKIYIWSISGELIQVIDRKSAMDMENHESRKYNDPSAPEYSSGSSRSGNHNRRPIIRDVSWSPTDCNLMSSAWEWDESGSVARHDWKELNKMNYSLESWVEKLDSNM